MARNDGGMKIFVGIVTLGGHGVIVQRNIGSATILAIGPTARVHMVGVCWEQA
jgi:hypothetical protein